MSDHPHEGDEPEGRVPGCEVAGFVDDFVRVDERGAGYDCGDTEPEDDELVAGEPACLRAWLGGGLELEDRCTRGKG